MKKTARVLLCALCAAAALCTGALAHSRFNWDTPVRPYHVLPFTFALSAAVEYAALVYIARVERGRRSFLIVLAGNALAYGAACAYYFISNRGELPDSGWPPYIIGAIFVCASFFVEVWCESELLQKRVKGNKGRLIWTLLAANALTGGAAALAERLICPGGWGA